MTKGQKTDILTIYKIMVSVFTTNNFSKSAEELDIPASTVENIYKKNKDKDEFVKLCAEKKKEFVETASEIIGKATDLLNKRLTTALEKQKELDLLLDTVYSITDDEMKPKEKLEIAKKLSRIQLNTLSEITTAIGTMYDKKALAEGKPTNSTTFNLTDDDRQLLQNVTKRLNE